MSLRARGEESKEGPAWAAEADTSHLTAVGPLAVLSALTAETTGMDCNGSESETLPRRVPVQTGTTGGMTDFQRFHICTISRTSDVLQERKQQLK